MALHTTPQVTALQAQATANLFLSDHLPDRFTAAQPHLDPRGDVWHVPVVLAYPGIGSIGQVGDILISTTTAAVVSSTSLTEMRRTAQDLYNAHRDAIEAAFL